MHGADDSKTLGNARAHVVLWHVESDNKGFLEERIWLRRDKAMDSPLTRGLRTESKKLVTYSQNLRVIQIAEVRYTFYII